MLATEPITINMIWATVVVVVAIFVFIYSMFNGGENE